MNRTLAAAGFLALLVGTAPRAEETPPAPNAKGDAPAADPAMERQRNSAAKLAGMINFVTYFCPEAKPNYDLFKQVVAAMGVNIKDLEQGGSLMVSSMSYTEAYRKDTPESCKRAFEHFGESGTTIPNLVARKPPEAPADKATEPPSAKPATPAPDKPQ